MGSAVRASIVMLGLLAVAADTSAPAQKARPPPIPKPGPLAQPRSTKQVGLPVDQTLAAIPPDNPQTPGKVALGEKLFFDGRLSADGTVACATCHDPQRAFTDGRPTSIGVQGRSGQRNSPTVLNALYNKTQFWDGTFGRPPNGQDLIAAIASYERSLTSFDSPFDRFLAGDQKAIDEAAKRGWVLFNDRARCNKCHALPDDMPD
jgi:cytochrome c peroxidase